MRKNKFFDTIMIALILMCSFKLLYPDAFTFNVTVNANGTSAEDAPFADLVFDTYADFFAHEKLIDTETGGTYTGLPCYGSTIYANSEIIKVVFESASEIEFTGKPYCTVAGINLYKVDIDSSYLSYAYYDVYNASFYITSEYTV